MAKGFKPPDGRSYTIDEDNNVLKIDGKKLTDHDKKRLSSLGITFPLDSNKKKKEGGNSKCH